MQRRGRGPSHQKAKALGLSSSSAPSSSGMKTPPWPRTRGIFRPCPRQRRPRPTASHGLEGRAAGPAQTAAPARRFGRRFGRRSGRRVRQKVRQWPCRRASQRAAPEQAPDVTRSLPCLRPAPGGHASRHPGGAGPQPCGAGMATWPVHHPAQAPVAQITPLNRADVQGHELADCLVLLAPDRRRSRPSSRAWPDGCSATSWPLRWLHPAGPAGRRLRARAAAAPFAERAHSPVRGPATC